MPQASVKKRQVNLPDMAGASLSQEGQKRVKAEVQAAIIRQAHQTAIAQEQENVTRQEAAKLNKANEVLKRSLQALAQNPDLNSFFGYLLVEMAHQFETSVSAVFLIEHPERRLVPYLIYEDGRVIAGKESDHPMAKNPRVFAADDPVWLTFCRNQPMIGRDPQSDTTLGWTEAHRAYYTRKGVTGIVNIPLIFGGDVIGTLAIQFRDDRSIDQEATELAQTFGLQATLALQLTKLAEQSKQVAMQAATLEERNRMAGEIHDSLAQSFVGISMQLEAAEAAASKAKCLRHVQRASELAQFGLSEARQR
ncbi:MAG TPA: histidine kinase, partial [Chthoniobacterales bacterium]|nr:histidine kinase [Chthoniobacterales bacterium]